MLMTRILLRSISETIATLPETMYGGEVGDLDYYDVAGALLFPAERMRRWITPADINGTGLVTTWNQNRTQRDLGPDAVGRVEFSSYFRPPGSPGVINTATTRVDPTTGTVPRQPNGLTHGSGSTFRCGQRQHQWQDDFLCGQHQPGRHHRSDGGEPISLSAGLDQQPAARTRVEPVSEPELHRLHAADQRGQHRRRLDTDWLCGCRRQQNSHRRFRPTTITVNANRSIRTA